MVGPLFENYSLSTRFMGIIVSFYGKQFYTVSSDYELLS